MFRKACVVDNRDAQEIYDYLEARIETLKRRIAELEEEETLRQTLPFSVIHPR